MKVHQLITILAIACSICACNESVKHNDLEPNGGGLTFECKDGVQIAHFADNSSLSISCDNYGGCDNASNMCVTLPKPEVASECVDHIFYCSNDVRFVCQDSNWLAVEACASGCNADHTCKSSVSSDCTDGEKKCEDNKAYLCSKGSWDEGVDCGTLGCDDVTKACKVNETPECTDGEMKCEDSTVYLCSDGSWDDGTDCGEFGCDDEGIGCGIHVTPECFVGETKCEDNIAYICSDGHWDDGTDCGEVGCDETTNACKVDETTKCTDGETKCEDNTVYLCSDGSWDEGTSCGTLGCDDEGIGCRIHVTPECTGDEKKCEDNKAYVCSGGTWGTGTDCGTLGCDDTTNACKVDETTKCTDGETKCEDNTVYLCSDGNWDEGTSCGTLGCDDEGIGCRIHVTPECTGDEKKCEDNKAYVCSGGTWGTGTDCGALGCDDTTNACKIPECTGEKKKCEGNKAYVCSGGTWGTGTDCGTLGCDSTTKACKVDLDFADTMCVFNHLYGLVDDHWDYIKDCSDGCDGRAKNCSVVTHVDGDKKCYGEKAYVYADGSWGSATSCAYGCDGDVCRSSAPAADEVYCVDGYEYSDNSGSLKKSACRGSYYCTDTGDCTQAEEYPLDDYPEANLCDTEDESFGSCANTDETLDIHFATGFYVTLTCVPPFESQFSEYDRSKLYWQFTAAHECESGYCAKNIGCSEWDLETDPECQCTPETNGLEKAYCVNYSYLDDSGIGGMLVTVKKHNMYIRRCICNGDDCFWGHLGGGKGESGYCPDHFKKDSTELNLFSCGHQPYLTENWCSTIPIDAMDFPEPKEEHSAKTQSYEYKHIKDGVCQIVTLNYKCNCWDDSSAYAGYSCEEEYVDTTVKDCL